MNAATPKHDCDHTRRNPFLSPSENPLRSAYPSDVSDQQWQTISPLLQRSSTVGRPRRHTLRNVVDAINYRWHTGCTWRMLPHDFPPWETVYTYFRVWQRRGVLRQIREAVLRSTSSKPRSDCENPGLVDSSSPPVADTNSDASQDCQTTGETRRIQEPAASQTECTK